MLRHFLYLLYLCPFLDLVCLCRMSYLYDLFFIFISILIMINLESHDNRHSCSFAYFSEYVLLFFDDNVNEECE